MHKIPLKHFPPHITSCNLSPPYIYSTNKNVIDIVSHNVCLTFVGSRRPSMYGKRSTESLIKALAHTPCCIISGLAYGIDIHALECALKYNIPCIAVPGSGIQLDVIYPRVHAPIAQKITEHGGALITQFEPNAHSKPWMFPVRNKVMAGICHATIVVEATESSGSLITAFHALEFNKDIFTVPGPIDSPTSYGTNKLLHYGAQPILSPQTLYEYVTNHSYIHNNRHSGTHHNLNQKLEANTTKTTQQNLQSKQKLQTYNTSYTSPVSLEVFILTYIQTVPCTLDTLMHHIQENFKTKITIPEQSESLSHEQILQTLFDLELKGFITKEQGLYTITPVHT